MYCLRGASAVEKILRDHPDPGLHIFVVWEKVLWSDLAPPTDGALARISDPRVTQFWDRSRRLSHAMGEVDRASLVWDWAGIYDRTAQWTAPPPEPVFSDGPVVNKIDAIAQRLSAALAK